MSQQVPQIPRANLMARRAEHVAESATEELNRSLAPLEAHTCTCCRRYQEAQRHHERPARRS